VLFLFGELKPEEFCPLGESADDGIGAVGLESVRAGSGSVVGDWKTIFEPPEK